MYLCGRPGVTCDEIDRVVHETITDGGGYPSPLNYHCFPKSVCTSVNEVICHGIPDARELVEGDIVNVDVTAYLGGYHGDLNETFLVGKVAPDVKKLVRTAYECLHKAIDICKPGTRYRDIGDIVSTHASKNGCAHGPVCRPSR
jgi:methionyl aminopeptidase